MKVRLHGRHFGLLVGTLAALSPAFFQPLPAAAAGTGTLFAISGPTQSELSRVDHTSGVVTPIEDLSGPSGQGQIVSITGDASSKRLFLMRSTTIFIPPTTINVTNEVLTLSSQSGAILSSAVLNGLANAFQFDPVSGNLFGLSQTGIVKVDPATGKVTPFAPNLVGFGSFISTLAVAPAAHTLYVSFENFDFINPPSTELFAVDSRNGAVLGSTTLTQAIRFIVYDPMVAELFGTTEELSRNLAQIDPATGNVNVIGPIPGDILQGVPTVDASSQTLFMDVQTFTPPFTFAEQVLSMNDQSGASTLAADSGVQLYSLYFETPATITPQSLEAAVRDASVSGAISNQGVANALLAELTAAEAARSRGQCGVAANLYQAFSNDVNAQSGKLIASGTAGSLIAEAQFLIANCP